MQVTVDNQSGVLVVRVAGSIDGLTSPALQQAMDREFAAGQTRVVADLEGVDYASSAGLRVLLGAVKDARSRGGDLRLAGVRDEVRRVLELAGFLSIMKVFPDTAAAVTSFAA